MIILCPFSLNAQASSPKSRPSVGLVLAGGGARGFAHIAVLQLLNELDIPIDIIFSNSAGSIIGGLYCAGLSPETIKKELVYLDWSTIFQDTVYSPYERTLGPHGTYTKPLALKLSKTFSLQMGTGLLTGQKVYELFKKITLNIPSNIDFDSLRTPFRAIAVDLFSGNVEILSHGDLAEAIRASMSIPTFFQPFVIDGKYYIDGIARDNLPIDVAHDYGCDIIIAVELSDDLQKNVEDFESNPFVALSQMIGMEQAVRRPDEYAMADLVLFPEVSEFSTIDYALAEEICIKAENDIQRYREPLLQLRKKIFLNKDSENIDTPRNTTKKQTITPTLPVITSLTIEGAIKKDIPFITQNFKQRLLNQELNRQNYETFMSNIYLKGNYSQVISRFSEAGELTLILKQNKAEKALALFGGEYHGTVALDSYRQISLSTDIQYRGLTGSGSVLSVSGTFLGDVSFSVMYMQPFGDRCFVRFTSNYINCPELISSGWVTTNIQSSMIRKKTAELACGLPLSQNHTIIVGAGIHHFNTEETKIETQEQVFTGDKYLTGDFFVDYTFTTLNRPVFPSSGISLTLQGTGVLPIYTSYNTHTTNNPIIFDIATMNIRGAIPITKQISLSLSGFAGFNLSQGLNQIASLLPIYGFSTGNDRIYFPQVSGSGLYGTIKIAASGVCLFAPWNQITIIGGQAFFCVSGSVGNVWSGYNTISLQNLIWRASLDAALRFTDTYSVVLRVGAGVTQNKVRPFVSLDFGDITF